MSFYMCLDSHIVDHDVHTISCGFTPHPKDIPLSDGEILTIRTENNSIIPHIDDIRRKFSYIFTFLIELDPF